MKGLGGGCDAAETSLYDDDLDSKGVIQLDVDKEKWSQWEEKGPFTKCATGTRKRRDNPSLNRMERE